MIPFSKVKFLSKVTFKYKQMFDKGTGGSLQTNFRFSGAGAGQVIHLFLTKKITIRNPPTLRNTHKIK